MSDIRKVLVLERCTKGCGWCEWILGSPRCTHTDMELKDADGEDPCLHVKVPSDHRLFHPDCPLPDYIESKTTEQVFDTWENKIVDLPEGQ